MYSLDEDKLLHELVTNGIYQIGHRSGCTVTMDRYNYKVSFITILAEAAEKKFPIHCVGFFSLVDFLEEVFYG